MIFCPQCGARVEERVPEADDRLRKVCPSCATIHYENPKMVVGCLVECEGKLLLCRRAIEPALGKWTPPAGYLELGEGSVAGAVRETYEEARAKVEVIGLQAYLDLPHIGQMYAFYRAKLERPEFEAGPESLDVALFDYDELPWDELAFPVVHYSLKLFLEDRERSSPAVHTGVLHWTGKGSRLDTKNYRLESHLRIPIAD